jgi:hypothetical protein
VGSKAPNLLNQERAQRESRRAVETPKHYQPTLQQIKDTLLPSPSGYLLNLEKKIMSQSSKNVFSTSRSTHIVTILRLILILLPHVLPFDTLFPSHWLYSSSLTSILIRPHQTLSHVREALAIQKLSGGRFADAYNAYSNIRLPPLVLAAITPILELPNPELWLSLLLLVIDFLIAYMIEAIGRKVLLSPNPNIDEEENEQSQLPEAIRPQNAHIFPIRREPCAESDPKPLLPMNSLPMLAAQLYYWSPMTAMPGGLYHCFQNLPAFFLLASLYESCRQNGSYSLSSFFLAVASYMEPHHVVFLVPLISLYQQNASCTNVQVMMIVFFGIWSASLQGLSYSLVGPAKYWDVVSATYGCGWRNLSPSLSLQWYFTMQLFSRFREYFGAILTGLPYLVVPPLAIRFYKYPMVLVSALCAGLVCLEPNV